MCEVDNKDKVSIIIPVYNGSNYVCQAVDSALKQTYKNIEIIVVNDGSSDGGMTRDCLKNYGSKIIYIEKENGGVASALNTGIKKMTGEYFTWLSHDDLFDESKIEKQMRAVKNSGDEMKISAMNYEFFDEDTRQSVASEFEKYFPIEKIENSIFLLLWGELHFSSLLFHKKHFERIGLFNENLMTAQDNDFIFRLLRGQNICFVKDVGSYVRLHSLAGTATNKETVNRENKKFYEWILTQLSDEELASLSGNKTKTINKIRGIIQGLGPVADKLEAVGTPIETNILLVGAGAYGRRLNYELLKNGFKPMFFLDNDYKKDGKSIDGIICKKFEIDNIPEKAMVVITNKFYKPFVVQLERMGIKNYYLKINIDSAIFNDSFEECLRLSDEMEE